MGKKYATAAKLVDKPAYTLTDAMPLIKKAAFAKFDETVELAMRLGVDPKHADQMVRGTVVLPHGLGKSKRVIVIASGEKVREARDAGADEAGGDDLVQRIQGGWLDFDAVVATPDMMKSVGKLGKVLGPRGLMPNPKTGTVTMDVARAVKEVKAGQAEALRRELERAKGVLLSGFEGLTVAQDTQLRDRIAKAGGTYRVVKNSLIERAAQGTPVAPVAQKLRGTTSLAFTETDPVAIAQIITEYAKEHPALV